MIDTLDISFTPGFSVITGETGADVYKRQSLSSRFYDFAATKEVIQANHFKNDNRLNDLVENPNLSLTEYIEGQLSLLGIPKEDAVVLLQKKHLSDPNREELKIICKVTVLS